MATSAAPAALAAALVAALMAAPAASAQAVPPRKAFVGPPAELAGSVPPPAKPFVGPPVALAGSDPNGPMMTDGERAVVGGVKTGASVVGGAAAATEAGGKVLDKSLRKLDVAADSGPLSMVPGLNGDPGPSDAKLLSGKAKVVGNGAKMVSFGANVVDAADKCSAAKVDVSECAKAGLSAGSGGVEMLEIISQAPVAGTVAKGLEAAGEGVAAYAKCSDPKASTAECVYASAKVVASAAGMIPGPPAVLSTTWALSTAGGEYLNSLAPDASVKLYDALFANEAVIKDATPAELETLRARRHAAYQRQKGVLEAKQADYDLQQQAIARQQAAAQAAAARAASPPPDYSGILAALQPNFAAPAGRPSPIVPSSGGGAPAPNAAPPPPSNRPPVDTGCHLTAADRAAGRVCTAR